MKILSFDIGIQNLAYCYFTIDFKSEKLFTIHDWGILTLSNNLCDYVNRKQIVCGKIAKFHESATNILRCKGHQDKCREKVQDDLLTLHATLVRKLDSVECDPDYVVIENQPKFNPKMKTIAAAVYTFYALRHKVDRETSLKDICYIHPNYKVTKVPYNGPELTDLPMDKYRKYKQLGILYTKYFLRKNDDDLVHFSEHRKQDDLADAFLNGFAYVMVNLGRQRVDALREQYDVQGTREEIMNILIRRNC